MPIFAIGGDQELDAGEPEQQPQHRPGQAHGKPGVAAALSLQAASLWPLFDAPLPRALLLLGVYAAIYALNAFGVKLGARAVMTLATLKLVPLFLLVVAGLAFVDTTQISFAFADVPSWTALGAAMVMVVFAYSGVETALIPGGEVRDPSRSVPRAALSAILLVVLLYLGLQIVCQGVLGPAWTRRPRPTTHCARHWAKTIWWR